MRSLEELRGQVKEEEVEVFDSRLQGIRQKIVSAVQAYGIVQVSEGTELESHSLGEAEGEGSWILNCSKGCCDECLII